MLRFSRVSRGMWRPCRRLLQAAEPQAAPSAAAPTTGRFARAVNSVIVASALAQWGMWSYFAYYWCRVEGSWTTAFAGAVAWDMFKSIGGLTFFAFGTIKLYITGAMRFMSIFSYVFCSTCFLVEWGLFDILFGKRQHIHGDLDNMPPLAIEEKRAGAAKTVA
jgi:hypothetical protein